MQLVFQIAGAVVSVYAILCIIRIIMTWLPGLEYTSIGRFFSRVCDPYLNIFSRLPFRIGMIDFSPVISIGILTLLSSVLSNIAITGRLHIGAILATVVSLVWGVFSSIITVLLIALVIRFCVLLFSGKNANYGSVWYQFDQMISPIVFKIAGIFMRGNYSDYKKALIISIIELITLYICGKFLIGFICGLMYMIPV